MIPSHAPRPTAEPPMVVCPDCWEYVLTEWIDVGTGIDEGYGAPAMHTDWQLVTTCACERPMDPALAE